MALGEAAARPRRAGRRDDRRRRAAGRPELGGAAGRRPRAVGNSTVVVDRNELQSDKPTEEILALGDLEAKFRAFGWHVDGVRRARPRRARDAFARLPAGRRHAEGARRRTIKGKGVSFMEHPAALAEGGGRIAGMRARRTTTRSRAPSSSSRPYRRAVRGSGSSRPRSSRRAERASAASRPSRNRAPARAGRLSRDEYVAEAYGEALLELAPNAHRPRRPRRRPRLGLPRPRLRARLPGAVLPVRDRGAGHGLHGRGHGPPRAAPGRELFRLLPRVARERADLQPGERGLEGRSTRSTTRASSPPAPASRTRASATSRCSRPSRT